MRERQQEELSCLALQHERQVNELRLEEQRLCDAECDAMRRERRAALEDQAAARGAEMAAVEGEHAAATRVLETEHVEALASVAEEQAGAMEALRAEQVGEASEQWRELAAEQASALAEVVAGLTITTLCCQNTILEQKPATLTLSGLFLLWSFCRQRSYIARAAHV